MDKIKFSCSLCIHLHLIVHIIFFFMLILHFIFCSITWIITFSLGIFWGLFFLIVDWEHGYVTKVLDQTQTEDVTCLNGLRRNLSTLHIFIHIFWNKFLWNKSRNINTYTSWINCTQHGNDVMLSTGKMSSNTIRLKVGVCNGQSNQHVSQSVSVYRPVHRGGFTHLSVGELQLQLTHLR